MGQELGPHEKSHSTRETRHGGRHAGEVDIYMIHRHTPHPCQPQVRLAQSANGSGRQCRDTGLACQQEFCHPGQLGQIWL
jgi:hypothetical protein